VDYRKIEELNPPGIDVDMIPFTKRHPYQCEAEFRVIWEGSTDSNYYAVEIHLRMVKKITISQKMPDALFHIIQKHLMDEFEIPEKRINHSTIYENRNWIEKFRTAPKEERP